MKKLIAIAILALSFNANAMDVEGFTNCIIESGEIIDEMYGNTEVDTSSIAALSDSVKDIKDKAKALNLSIEICSTLFGLK